MTPRCQHCKAECQLFLCDNCQITLANMLNEIPWLLDELDNRIQQLDRINQGTIGRNRRPNEMAAIDFDAAETSRAVRKTLLKWVETVAERHNGRRPTALGTVHTKQLARWLEANTAAIARLDLADKGRHPLYDDITRIAGNPTNPQGGQLHHAINKHERHFAGTCPTTTSHNRDGEPIECGTMLYADTDQTTIKCPTCKHTINVEQNRLKTSIDRDLMTEPKTLEVMADLGEKISRVTFYQWVREGRARPRGWIHNGAITQHRIKRGDPAVYSLKQFRKLRARKQSRQEANAQ